MLKSKNPKLQAFHPPESRALKRLQSLELSGKDGDLRLSLWICQPKLSLSRFDPLLDVRSSWVSFFSDPSWRQLRQWSITGTQQGHHHRRLPDSILGLLLPDSSLSPCQGLFHWPFSFFFQILLHLLFGCRENKEFGAIGESDLWYLISFYFHFHF